MKTLIKKILQRARRRDRIRQGPDKRSSDEPGMEAAIERAEAAMAERDWGRATALWREVLDEFGDHAPRKAHLRLSRALRGDGHIVAAQAALLEGLKRYPEDLRLQREVAVQRAEAAMAGRDWGRATTLWREVLARFGDGAPRKTHLRLSQALRGDGQIVAAQSALLQGLKRDPEDRRLRRELAVQRAEAATRRAAAAQAALLEQLKRDPEDLRLRRKLAELARPRPPSPARGIVSKADLAASKADWERVARLWEEVLGSVSTPTPEMANGLVGALCQLGRFREADEVLQRALAAGIDHRDVQSVFDSEVLRAQFLGRFGQTASSAVKRREDRKEWYRVAVGARRLRDASGLNAAVTKPSAIWVSYRGRFGNSLRELVHALDVAERLDVPRVYIPPAQVGDIAAEEEARRDTWYLERNDRFYFRSHEVIQSDSPSPEERLVLRGRFLAVRALNTVLPETEKPYRLLAELRPFTVFRDREPLREDDLAIHIRAGDIFERGKAHPNYGQPPLTYYLTVLRQRRWRSVHLVYENDANPLIEPLLAHLRAEGIDHRTVVTDLRSTIEFLLRAKTIVAGNGTFIPTIAGLSSNLRRLYSFEGRGQAGDWGRPGVAQIDVIDDRGDYRRAVMSGNWENRPDQVELMLHYPESALRVAPGPAKRRDVRGARDQTSIRTG